MELRRVFIVYNRDIPRAGLEGVMGAIALASQAIWRLPHSLARKGGDRPGL